MFSANASAAVTMGGVTVNRSTSGNSGPGGSGPATKTYVDAYIKLSPLTATNFVGSNHLITATVFTDSGGGAGPVLTGNVLVTFSKVTGPGSFVGNISTCTTDPGGPNLGMCSIQITSVDTGTTVIHAVVNVSVNGVSLTRATGDRISQDSADAQKIWQPRTPTLTTVVLLGDTVTVSGLNVTGTVDFRLFGPSASNNPDCTGTPLATFSGVQLSSSGTASTPSDTPLTTGPLHHPPA